MESVIDLLSPEQIDAIFAAYSSFAEWYSNVVDQITQQAQIVVEDVML